MKIDMYTLLGLVKDGKAPKKIKYKDKIYYYHKGYDFNYMYNSSSSSLMDNKKSLFVFSSYKLKDGRQYWDDNTAIDFLNNEVEILEEEKKLPEKLKTHKEVDDEDCFANILKVSENGECEIDEATSVIVDKINEIIDYLKSKGE